MYSTVRSSKLLLRSLGVHAECGLIDQDSEIDQVPVQIKEGTQILESIKDSEPFSTSRDDSFPWWDPDFR